jgi:VIT1/CCC1 family predicted Fe2+/Mn2+ transporter
MTDQLHSPLETRLQEWHGEIWHTPKGRLIRDIVYGVDTGLVTTVSFLAGISLTLVLRSKILLAGLIEATAGTLAIFFGAYISTKAQKHFFESQIEREKKEIEDQPEKEKLEIRQIFQEMGFTPEEQEIAVKRISADKERWLKFMVQEEIGIAPGMIDSPWEIGFISAGSYLVGAIPALLPFLFFSDSRPALLVSAGSVLVFLFILGVAKTRVTRARPLLSGLETLLVGAVSCGAGFLLGRLVQGYFH